jgi:hypothetical protein
VQPGVKKLCRLSIISIIQALDFKSPKKVIFYFTQVLSALRSANNNLRAKNQVKEIKIYKI